MHPDIPGGHMVKIIMKEKIEVLPLLGLIAHCSPHTVY